MVKPLRLSERPYKLKTRIFEYFFPRTSIEFAVTAASVAPLDSRVVAYFDHNQFAHNDALETVGGALVHFFS